jgi:hypothetical protein
MIINKFGNTPKPNKKTNDNGPVVEAISHGTTTL